MPKRASRSSRSIFFGRERTVEEMHEVWICVAWVMLVVLLAALRATGETAKETVRRSVTASNRGVEIDGALFFDRGHYWVEVHLAGTGGGPPPERKHFLIVDASENVFSPSRVEVLEWKDGGGVLLLSSGRLKGRTCYWVILRSEDMGTAETPIICDPF